MEKTFEEYRKTAEQGDADAQSSLSSCYYYGYGVTRDKAQSAYWHKKEIERRRADNNHNNQKLN